jgi:hypothetical protein
VTWTAALGRSGRLDGLAVFPTLETALPQLALLLLALALLRWPRFGPRRAASAGS